MYRYIILLFVCLFSITAFSASKDSVIIFGTAPEYANMQLAVEYRSNYISTEYKELKRFVVDENGLFKTVFYVPNTTRVQIKLGETVGYLIVEPGNFYQIILPPYYPLKPENKLNPFFVPELILLGIYNDDQINIKVRDFEDEYNYLFSKNIQKIVLTGNHKAAQQIIDKTDNKFPSDSATWFYYYKHFKYLSLKSYIYSNQKRRVIKEGFSDIPVQYSLDPYWESFNHIFKGFFHYYSASKYGSEFKKFISSSESFDTICHSLVKDPLFQNREFAELVVLKGLYDAFYSNNYAKERIINLVKSAVSECYCKANRLIANDILLKIAKLRVGSSAPAFDLPTLSGKNKELKDFKGKFVYLNFANTQNYACKKDLQVLNQLAKIYKRDMHIVTILTDDDPDAAFDYVKNNKLKWSFLHFNQNGKVLLDYAIKAFPTYYLIDPDGNIILAPAPAPEEEFVSMFSEIYNAYRYKKLRREKPKSRTIYDL